MEVSDAGKEVMRGSIMLLCSMAILCLVCICFVFIHTLFTMEHRRHDIQQMPRALSLNSLSIMPSGHGGRYQSLLHQGVDLRHTPGIQPELLNTESILLSPSLGALK